jgi:acyl-CoA synthetase (AMP-forming)/AMP-acid ligase II
MAHASILAGRLEDFRGRSVLIAVRDQLHAAMTLLELDGVAERVVLCTPDLSADHLLSVIRGAATDAWVGDPDVPVAVGPEIEISVTVAPMLRPEDVTRRCSHQTEWVLLTSGTVGAPKLVAHSLESLTAALTGHRQPVATAPLWSTFYDIRRYGGLQILLRALHGGGGLVLSSPAEPVVDFLVRAGALGVTHISGTPSHWRRALMSGAASRISPRYVRLSGEIADQAILDALRAAYPNARVAHAFASTEAGVAFEVGDGLAGFPASLLSECASGVEMKITDGTLRIRSAGNASRYLGSEAGHLKGADGFVDTGDRVELHDGRYYFRGRTGGVINVGGLKVHPEEVESVINAHPWVRMSLVKSRRSPIMGAMVTADVVLTGEGGAPGSRPSDEVLGRQIIEACRQALAAHKIPASIRIVPALEMSASGKLVRNDA